MDQTRCSPCQGVAKLPLRDLLVFSIKIVRTFWPVVNGFVWCKSNIDWLFQSYYWLITCASGVHMIIYVPKIINYNVMFMRLIMLPSNQDVEVN